ncbi:MAG: Lrp/AsnC family transcriptional regulator [Euryarchaeota archaeon]|nr:Lrp/AsnC family transcriptional regulator [Euryarchaeota archaeon]
MDDVDRKILEMLVRNSRTPYKEIAKKTKISDVAVHKRIKKLEKGTIKAFTVLIHQEAVGRPITCILSIRCSISDSASIAREISRIDDVTEVYTTLGEYDIIAKIRTRSIGRLREIVEKEVSKIKGINEVRASVVFECLKEDVSLVF